jgi:hypothetical protein
MNNPSLSTSLKEIAANLQRAAENILSLPIDMDERDLPPVLFVRHVAKYEGWSKATVWRKAHLGLLPPTITPPKTGEPLRWDKQVYLAVRRQHREQALAEIRRSAAATTREQSAESVGPGPDRGRRGCGVDK